MNPFLDLWHLFKFLCLLTLLLLGIFILRPLLKDHISENQEKETQFYFELCKNPTQTIRCKDEH